MSFVPEKFPENPRMAPEKYGMYVCLSVYVFQKNYSRERVPLQMGFCQFLITWRILARKNVRDCQK